MAVAGSEIALKDCFFHDDGVPSMGSRVPPPHRGPEAEVLRRLAEAGATWSFVTLDEWVVSASGTVSAAGPVLNPWDPRRAPGGSSSGCGVALASGAARMAVGTDAGGSIRIPSAWCRVVGLKPTRGAVPATGYVLEGGPPVDHVGPMARSVDDAAALFEVLAGAPVGPAGVGALRVGIAEEHFFDGLEAPVAAAMDDVIGRLRASVASLERVAIPGAPHATEVVATLLLSHVAGVLDGRFEELLPPTRSLLEDGARRTPAEIDAARRAVDEMEAAFARLFEEVDVVVTPTVPTTAPSVEEAGAHVLRALGCNTPMNLGGVPVLSVPCADGVNVSFTAAARREDVVTAMGRWVEEATGRAYVNRIAP